MSEHLANRIRKRSSHFSMKGISQQVARRKYIMGFDSEADTTSDGRPMLFQFSLPRQAEEDTTLIVVPDKPYGGLEVFLDFLEQTCISRDYEYLIYVWNLRYELTQLFRDLPDQIKRQEAIHINNIRDYQWRIRLLNYKREILEFSKVDINHKARIVVRVLDGMAFYKIGLDGAAKMLGVGEKYELGSLARSKFTRDDLTDEAFLSYARRDAYITRLIGEYIQDQHKLYDIPTTISAPHFASTVFKIQFLTTGLRVPSPDLEQAGLSSYHGGKNGFYLSGPSEFPSIYQYDITSAYPEAMKQLPNVETGLWEKVDRYQRGQHALYCVTMNYYACMYRGMQNHNGSWSLSGLVTDVWITGYELDAILLRGEAVILSCHGYVFRGDPGGPLSDYVDRFFSIKQHSKGPERETAKLLLNSLYGKFFQKQPLGAIGTYDLEKEGWKRADPTADFDYEAGGLYHPPIASLITGFVRARIHALEHKYESVMTSTDGMFGPNPPDKDDLGGMLGELTTSKGRLRIWRERLYIFDSDDGRKVALHGFRGRTAELEDIPLAHGEYLYDSLQMMTLKMSTKKLQGTKYGAGQFVKLPYKLKI